MADNKKKSERRESKPLAESPKYNADASTLAENIKKIQADSAARKEQAYAERKVARDKRREAMNSKGRQAGDGGRLQGLNTSLGGKIVK
jgi:membrane protein involved in colicin uptake